MQGIPPLMARAALALALAAGLAPPAGAQDRIDPQRERRAAPGAPAAPAPAPDDAALTGGREVSYEEILRAPDNVPLNLAYARMLMRRGDLLAAAGVLERILLIAPDHAEARLLYGVALYRLDNAAEAEREMRAARAADLPPALRREVDRYLAELRRRQSATVASAVLRVGAQYDSNRNFTPGGRILNGPFFPPERRAPGFESDWSGHAFLRGEIEHDLGLPRRHRLLGAVNLYHVEQARLDRFTAAGADVALGAALDFRPIELTLLAHWRHAALSHQTLANFWGGSVLAEWQTRGRVTPYLLFHMEHQAYLGISEARDGSRFSGTEIRVATGLRILAAPEHRFNIQGQWLRKNTRIEADNYSGVALSAEHTWLLPYGAFLITDATIEYNRHDTPEFDIAERVRADTILRMRMTLGAPLGAAFDLPAPLAQTVASLHLEWANSVSTVRNYSYENYRIGIAFTKRFDLWPRR